MSPLLLTLLPLPKAAHRHEAHGKQQKPKEAAPAPSAAPPPGASPPSSESLGAGVSMLCLLLLLGGAGRVYWREISSISGSLSTWGLHMNAHLSALLGAATCAVLLTQSNSIGAAWGETVPALTLTYAFLVPLLIGQSASL